MPLIVYPFHENDRITQKQHTGVKWAGVWVLEHQNRRKTIDSSSTFHFFARGQRKCARLHCDGAAVGYPLFPVCPLCIGLHAGVRPR